MELTKHGHSCVTIETGTRAGHVRLCVDPGGFSDTRAALRGADAVLVTHAHADHLDPDAVLAFLASTPGVRLYAPADVVAVLAARPDAAGLGERLVALGPDEEFFAAGVPVRTVGGQHALIHPLLRTIDNLGYIVDGRVYHPGDALVVPAGDRRLEALLVPVWAPWSKTSEVVDFIAAVRARRAYGIHDAPLNEAGHGIVEAQLAGLGGRTGTAYSPWAPGERLAV